MASYSFKLREKCDVCHFVLSTEKEYGVQCIFLKDLNLQRDYSVLSKNVVKMLHDATKDAVFIQIASPGKAFEKFDLEKHKIILTTKAYLSLLDFFKLNGPFCRLAWNLITMT